MISEVIIKILSAWFHKFHWKQVLRIQNWVTLIFDIALWRENYYFDNLNKTELILHFYNKR